LWERTLVDEPAAKLPAHSGESRGLVQRVRHLFTRRKMPAWMVILLLAVEEIPDWKSRFDFWLDAVRNMGGEIGIAATVIASPLFSFAVLAGAILYLVFVGEPAKGVQRHHWWPYLGWGFFGICFAATFITGIVGYVEIYIQKEVGQRENEIQRQALGTHVFWHLTDFDKLSLGRELDKVPDKARFDVRIECSGGPDSRTYTDDLGAVFSSHNWALSQSEISA